MAFSVILEAIFLSTYMIRCPNPECSNCTDFTLYTSIAVRIDGDLNVTQSVNLRTAIDFLTLMPKLNATNVGRKGR